MVHFKNVLGLVLHFCALSFFGLHLEKTIHTLSFSVRYLLTTKVILFTMLLSCVF